MTPQLLPFALLLWLSGCAASPPRNPAPPPGPAPAAVYTSDGRVLGVERGSPSDPASYLHIVIQPGAEDPVRVELGPGWYLDEKGLRFSTEDNVHVEGKRVLRDGKPVVIANKVKRGNEMLNLRDENDRPLWNDAPPAAAPAGSAAPATSAPPAAPPAP